MVFVNKAHKLYSINQLANPIDLGIVILLIFLPSKPVVKQTTRPSRCGLFDSVISMWMLKRCFGRELMPLRFSTDPDFIPHVTAHKNNVKAFFGFD